MRGPPGERSPRQLLEFGIVNLDKPPGPSAHQVAGWVRDACDLDRVAHAGTLDPKVTGCLPILLGDAARAARVFDGATKEYVSVLELHGPAPADLEAVVSEFEAEIYQRPPRKSAVARRLRTRTIHELDVLEVQDRKALLRIRCESGTYVRKLCHHIGLALGTGAHMGDLRRTATAAYDDTSLVTMHDLVDAVAFWEAEGDPAPLNDVVKPAEHALRGLPKVTVPENAAAEIAEGAPLYAPGVIEVTGDPVPGDLVVCYTPDGAAVSLGELVGDPDAESDVVVSTERVLV